jgi:enoyl-CoA hydratase/carnithine racemase
VENYVSTLTHQCGRGFIGEIVLRRDASLNALSLEMFKGLLHVLSEWEKREDIFFIFLHSSSSKAFCAGGDVKSLALKLREDRESHEVKDFFKFEYKTDYTLQNYSKPIVGWGEGIVMGGGLGLFNGLSHRVVTKKTLLAMPEVGIGFFPDVGSGYFLNKIPFNLGTFLGATGGRFSAQDAHFLKLADYLLEDNMKEKVFSELLRERWSDNQDEVENKLDYHLNNFQIKSHETSEAEKWKDEIQKRLEFSSWKVIYENLLSWEPPRDSWPSRCLSFFREGSPLSVALTLKHLEKTKTKSCVDVFLDELNFSYQFCKNNDFVEGVRALLIDKDKRPKWEFDNFENILDHKLESYFDSLIDRDAMKLFFNSDFQDLKNHHHQEFQS